MMSLPRAFPRFGFLFASAAFGCSSPKPIVARVVMESTLGPGDAGPQACLVAGNAAPFVVIGTEAAPVDDGGEFGGGTVAVKCRIQPSGAVFKVDAQSVLSKAGTASGTVSIVGDFPSDKAAVVKVQADFSKSTGNFKQHDCTVSYSKEQQGVAAGRVWADLVCPTMREESKQLECEGKATFKFENCLQ
jgi:hypothetical protein